MSLEKIVVLGGSFNPPTIGHLKLMQTAMAAIGADKGFFVPTPFWYVERKLKKAGQKEDAISNDLRLEMLASLCEEDETLFVSDYEMFRKEKGFTFETLQRIGLENPNSTIYFVAGSDKLDIIPKWHRVHEFLAEFKILLAKRNHEEPADMIAAHPFLSQHKEAFHIFETSEDVAEISSSLFREKFRNGDETGKELVTEAVWDLMLQRQKVLHPSDTADKIASFRGEYFFLSNFYNCPIVYQGLVYENNEAAFQAQKCVTEGEKERFCHIPPNQAKSLGRSVQMRSDWETIKIGVMEDVVYLKFTQHPDLAEKLLATGDRELVEGNTWGDSFWGFDTRTQQGENHLGIILMQVRAQLGG